MTQMNLTYETKTDSERTGCQRGGEWASWGGGGRGEWASGGGERGRGVGEAGVSGRRPSRIECMNEALL